jgi:hypothetical protein
MNDKAMIFYIDFQGLKQKKDLPLFNQLASFLEKYRSCPWPAARKKCGLFNLKI